MSEAPLPRIAGYYLALYGVTGLLLPYLPVHFLALGFTGSQVAALSSVTAAATVVLPPVWGYLADRTGRAATLLAVSTGCWALAIAGHLGARTFGAVLGVMVVQSFFGSSLSTLIDALAMTAAGRAGVEYARLRLWGSIGFIVTSLVFGQALARGVQAWAVIPAALVAAGVATAVAASLPPRLLSASRRVTPGDVVTLVRRPELWMFFVATALHWASFSPYNLFLSAHFQRVTGSTALVGLALAVGVSAEVGAMRAFGRLRASLPLVPLLGVAFALNVVRWAGMAWVTSGAALVLLQVIHGLSFGVFFVGSVAFLEQSVPEAARSTGRALYGAFVFGLGGMAGHQLAGWVYDHGGTPRAFQVAAWVELGALLALGCLVLARRVEATRDGAG